jgi:hypothetical protein
MDAMSDEVVSAEEAQARVTQMRSVVDELAREVAERGSGAPGYRSTKRELKAARRELLFAEAVVILRRELAALREEASCGGSFPASATFSPRILRLLTKRISARKPRRPKRFTEKSVRRLVEAGKELVWGGKLPAALRGDGPRMGIARMARKDLLGFAGSGRAATAAGKGQEELASKLNALRETDSPRAREAQILGEIERLKRELDTVWASDRARADEDRLRRAMDPESLPVEPSPPSALTPEGDPLSRLPSREARVAALFAETEDLIRDFPPEPSWTVPADVRPVGLPSWAVPGFLRPVAPRGGPFARGPSEIPVSVRRAPAAVLAPAQEAAAPLAPPADEGER